MHAVFVLRVAPLPLAHRLLGLGRELETEEVVDPADLLQRVAHDVPVVDVQEVAGVVAIADFHGTVDGPQCVGRKLCTHLMRIDDIAEDRAAVGDHAAEGRDHANRVAVRLNDLGIRKDLEQRVDVLEVVRRLAQPTAGALPEQRLNHASQGSVGRPLVAADQPVRVARHRQGGVRGRADEAHVHQQHVFLGAVGLDGMDREELGRHVAKPALGGLAELHARIAARRLPSAGERAGQRAEDRMGLGQRQGAERFPRKQRAQRGLAGEQAVQQCRPSALQTRDEDRRFDGQGRDLGMQIARLLETQAARQPANHDLTHRNASDGIQLRFALERCQ